MNQTLVGALLESAVHAALLFLQAVHMFNVTPVCERCACMSGRTGYDCQCLFLIRVFADMHAPFWTRFDAFQSLLESHLVADNQIGVRVCVRACVSE